MANLKSLWEKSIKQEIKEIRKHRFYIKKRLGYDIGLEAAAKDWVDKYAASFRSNWNQNK